MVEVDAVASDAPRLSGARVAQHGRSVASKNRHIKTKYFLIMDHINTELVVPWLPGTANPADLLTKPLGHDTTLKHSNALFYGRSGPEPTPCGGVYEPFLAGFPDRPPYQARPAQVPKKDTKASLDQIEVS